MASPALQAQLRQLEWADAALWRAVLATPAARAEPRVHALLHHVHLVQQLYLQIWRGEPPTLTPADAFADLDALHHWARRFHAPAQAHLAALPPEALARPVAFPWAAQLEASFGVVHPATLQESVLQVVHHSAHHRAQLCTRLRELGGTPPTVDFIVWVWQGKPAPAWPDAQPSQ